MSKKCPRFIDLSNDDPTVLKIKQLEDLSKQLGILIIYAFNKIWVIDFANHENPIYLSDMLDNISCVSNEFPCSKPHKWITDNPVYLQKIEKQNKILEEQRRIKEEKLLKQKAAKEADYKKSVEENERKQLALLKAKYPEDNSK